MSGILRLWPYGLGVIASLFISYQIGHLRGYTAGLRYAQNVEMAIKAKEAIKSQSLREKVEDETRNLSNADVDAGLRSGGWMRSDKDR